MVQWSKSSPGSPMLKQDLGKRVTKESCAWNCDSGWTQLSDCCESSCVLPCRIGLHSGINAGAGKIQEQVQEQRGWLLSSTWWASLCMCPSGAEGRSPVPLSHGKALTTSWHTEHNLNKFCCLFWINFFLELMHRADLHTVHCLPHFPVFAKLEMIIKSYLQKVISFIIDSKLLLHVMFQTKRWIAFSFFFFSINSMYILQKSDCLFWKTSF